MKKNAKNIQEFADDLKNFTDHPLKGFGMFNGDDETDKKIDAIMRDMIMATAAIAQIAKELEFFINGDISRDVLLERYAAIEKDQETKLAGITG